MRVITFASGLVLAALAAAIPVFEPVETAHACSSGGSDMVDLSDLVVRGTVTAWDYERDASGEPIERESNMTFSRPEYTPRERPVAMTLEIQSVFKGTAPDTLQVNTRHFDRRLDAEGVAPFPGWVWPGAAGACFALGEDPTGRDALYFLQRVDEGDEMTVWPFDYPNVYPGFWEEHPALTPRPPSVGDSPILAAEPSSDFVWLSAIGAGLLILTLVLVFGTVPRHHHHNRES